MGKREDAYFRPTVLEQFLAETVARRDRGEFNFPLEGDMTGDELAKRAEVYDIYRGGVHDLLREAVALVRELESNALTPAEARMIQFAAIWDAPLRDKLQRIVAVENAPSD